MPNIQKSVNFQEVVRNAILNMPDEELQKITFSNPWQYSPDTGDYEDPDKKEGVTNMDNTSRESLHDQCWEKLHKNPQVNTAVRGLAGRMTGWGFEVTSENYKIQREIFLLEKDPRNRLFSFYPKFAARSIVENELFISLTCHDDGFIEIDFIDPSTVRGIGTNDEGIIFHPTKAWFPLFFNIRSRFGYDATEEDVQIPSINIAYFPNLVQIAKKSEYYDRKLQIDSRPGTGKYRKFGGYNRFIVAWDKGFITKRAISYLVTTLEWLNHYENLKKYEIDHKKSSGAYLWLFKITDAKSFKLWLSLTDEERRKTGITEKKTPGGSLVIPPGMDVECKNPNLTAIKDQDTDIMHMATSGLNEPADITTGESKGTFASVKASRGPMSDRTSDEIASWDNFLKWDFWKGVFFLKSRISKFPKVFKERECVDFVKGEPQFEMVEKFPEELIDISYPVSEVVDFESRAKAFLGVKHGPLAETMGMDNKSIAKRMGIGGYANTRRKKATEDDKYPELDYAVDSESLQETTEGETPKKVVVKKGTSTKKTKGKEK